MKSKTSLYNHGLGRSLFKLCWPLWVLWFSLLILEMPVNLAAEISRYVKYDIPNIELRVIRCIFDYAVSHTIYVILAAPIAALLMFSFLYTSRGSGMIASLPIKREGIFVTSFLTGVVPLLLAEVLTAVITLLVCGGSGYFDSAYIWKWLWMVASSTVAFYGIAVFCAQLTGSIAIMPITYIVLNLLPNLAYSCISIMLQNLLYGYQFSDSKLFTNLSPFFGISSVSVTDNGIYGNTTLTTAEITVSNYELYGYYCIAGLVLSVIALLLFRKRRMESAGDIVAIGVLKPVFKYCVAFGVACCFTAIMNSILSDNAFGRAFNDVLLFVFLAVGAFGGYFAAQMLLDKSVNVFSGHWKGFLIFTAILLALTGCCKGDVFGYERYVPDTDEIDSVFVRYSVETEFREEENIEKLTAIHRQIIENKAMNEQPSFDYDILGIAYNLKNGKTVSRTYHIPRYTDSEKEEINPTLYALEDVINAEEAIKSRAELPAGITFRDLDYATISGFYITPDGTQQPQDVELSKAWAEELFYDCILPDAYDGHMLRIWPILGDEYEHARSTLYISFSFKPDGASSWKEYVVYTDAERCCEWIKEHTNLIIQSYADLNGEEYPMTVSVY